MSDTKKKDGANSTATPKRPSKGAKGVCEILSKIFTLVSEIKDDPAGFEEHESIVANLDSLKKQIDEKDEKSKIAIDDKDKKIESLEKEISDLNTHKQRMWDEFDAKYTDFIKKTGDHETLQERLQQVMAELEQSNDRYENAKQVNEDVKKDLDVCKAELDNTKSRLKSLEKERERLDLELRTSEMREQELHDDLGLNKLEDIPLADYKQKFEDFAEKCHQLALDFFLHNITEAVLEDIKSQISEPEGLHLSSSTSPAARLTRCALAESVIASAITYHIFAEIPFPKQPNVQWSIRAILDLFEPHSSDRGERQNIVRCQLLAEYAEEQNNEKTHNMAIENAVRECVNRLHPMLADSDVLPDFKARLRALCKEGIHIWSPLKWSISRVVADCSPNIDSWMEVDYDDDKITFAETVEHERRGTEPEALLQLFPRILWDQKVLMDGYVLVSTQKAVFTPKKTASNRPPPTANTNGHARLSRARTDSISHTSRPSIGSGPVSLRSSQQRSVSRSGPGGSLQSPPASPTTDRRNGA